MTREQTHDDGRHLSADYNDPPEAPREEIWEGVRAELERSGALQGNADSSRSGIVELGSADRRFHRPIQIVAWAAAAAIVLFMGVGIGSRTSDGSSGAMSSETPPPGMAGEMLGDATGSVDGAGEAVLAGNSVDGRGGSLQRAATDVLSASETFLAMVRSDARQGRLEPEIGGWARSLLTETRLLMDSPLSADPEVALLLGELELTLIQVVQAARTQETDTTRSSRELELLTTRLESSNMAPRIEAMTPVLTNGNGS